MPRSSSSSAVLAAVARHLSPPTGGGGEPRPRRRPAPAPAASGWFADTPVDVPPLPAQRRLGDLRAAGEGHRWADTPHGAVHYRLYNEAALAAQPLCVLCHGFSISGVRHFDGLAAAIASRGVPVLTLDLFGRGLSDRPLVRYDGALYTACVAGLLRTLGFDASPVDILGFSMGGAVIQHFVDTFPQLVRRMIFYAPGGAQSTETPVPARHASLSYGLDLMASAAKDAAAEDGRSGDEHSWASYYSAQFRR